MVGSGILPFIDSLLTERIGEKPWDFGCCFPLLPIGDERRGECIGVASEP